MIGRVEDIMDADCSRSTELRSSITLYRNAAALIILAAGISLRRRRNCIIEWALRGVSRGRARSLALLRHRDLFPFALTVSRTVTLTTIPTL